MKKISYLILVIGLSAISIFYLQFSEKEKFYPKPTDTIIHEGGEDGDSQLKREAWFELMHQAAPGTNWRDLERQTQMQRNKTRIKAGHYGLQNRGGELEEIAGGKMKGIWEERGSNNQAGSVHETEYDVETDEIWLISDGGTLFKGARDGSNWEVINQNVKFSNGLLKFIPTDDGRRLIAPIERMPHFSDDDGLTWTAATGLSINDNWANIRHSVVLEDSLHTIFLISKQDYWADIKLYKSIDKGESYAAIHTFPTNSFNHVKICKPHHSNEVYLIERGDETKFYQINSDTDNLDLLNTSAQMLFDGERANLTGTMVNDSITIFYTYNNSGEVYKTTDFGENWEQRGSFNADPWSVGMYVSEVDTNVLFIGEVNCFRSADGGENWTLINEWWEYYDDVDGKLHADIMYFNEFEAADGTSFLLVSNHGGLNISYNHLATLQNIGLAGLNVSQYYSVKSLPNIPEVIYAGTQDQGFQMGFAFEEGPIDMDQIISGDYGHIVFSNSGQDLWTVYPGGWVTYYRNAQFGQFTSSYDLESENETVWLPPLMESPDPAENAIYMAGGNIDGGAGSFMIKLEAELNNEITATQLDFDFYDNSGDGTLSAMEYSTLNTDKFYAATTNGRFFHSEDAGENWEQTLNFIPEGHWLYGQTIYASKKDTNLVWLGGSGYSNSAVWKSTNGGTFFTTMNTGMPSTLVFEITGNADETALFAATEAGPFVYIFEEEQWFDMSGLCAPTQTYWSVEYIESQEIVRFGTYGRGVWDFKIEEFVNTENPEIIAQKIAVYPNPSDGIFNVSVKNLSEKVNSIVVHDLSGKLLETIAVQNVGNDLNETLNLSNYTKGIYFLRMEIGRKVFSKKIVLQ